jgi:ABC-2 type transport system permease protein
MFLGVLISNSLLAVVVLLEVGSRLLRHSHSRLQGLVSPRRSVRPALVDRLALWLTRWLPLTMRMLIVKDLRLFRRDPVQWSQFLIFFGLLALYFINIRRFQYGEPLQRWMNMIGFLNLGVVGLILSTFTTRFIFPMISLEGRRFWILGSMPIQRDTVLWSKLVFAFGGSVLPCAGLIFLSDVMLGIVRHAPEVALVHQLTCWTLCVGLSAIAVGLGARLPDLRQCSPSRIAAGFGGTLNLVLSALFIVATVLLTAVPCHFLLEARESGGGEVVARGWWSETFGLGTPGAVTLGVAAMLTLGVVATVVSLRLGFRAFRRLEF